jgi:tRNA pseudouridine38-40 synthase
MTIQYDGAKYKGWQRLGSGEKTIQGKIEQVIGELVGKPVEIIGASRTDAGVHALGQVANVKLDEDIGETKLYNVLNHQLPPDICVLSVERVPETFHARFDAIEKTYLYKIWNEPHSHPFMRRYSMHVKKKLNIDDMRKAAVHFLGEHDFTAYSNAKANKKKTVRKIYALDILPHDGFIDIRIRGDGFLYNMVRKIAGTLIEVGMGEKHADEVPLIIESRDRGRTGRMAEAQGLYLENITY